MFCFCSYFGAVVFVFLLSVFFVVCSVLIFFYGGVVYFRLGLFVICSRLLLAQADKKAGRTNIRSPSLLLCAEIFCALNLCFALVHMYIYIQYFVCCCHFRIFRLLRFFLIFFLYFPMFFHGLSYFFVGDFGSCLNRYCRFFFRDIR